MLNTFLVIKSYGVSGLIFSLNSSMQVADGYMWFTIGSLHKNSMMMMMMMILNSTDDATLYSKCDRASEP